MSGAWGKAVCALQSGVEEDPWMDESAQRKTRIVCRFFLHFCGVDFDIDA